MIEMKKVAQYKEGQSQWEQRGRELYDAIKDAEQRVADAKAAQQAEVARLVMANEYTSEALDTCKREVAEAVAALELANEKRTVFMQVGKPSMTPEEVVEHWNTVELPQYKAEVFEPILERLLETKLAHIEAVLDYYAAIEEQEDAVRVANVVIGDRYRYRFQRARLETRHDVDKHMITPHALQFLEGRKVPDNVKALFNEYKANKAKKGGK